MAISGQPVAGSSGLNTSLSSMAESQIPMPQVSTAWPRPQEGRLTYEGLFVGASLLHVRAWPDSTATVVHLVHDATTWKEGKGEETFVPLTGMRKHP